MLLYAVNWAVQQTSPPSEIDKQTHDALKDMEKRQAENSELLQGIQEQQAVNSELLRRVEEMLVKAQEGNTSIVEKFAKDNGLAELYPNGFTLFYYDGRRTVHWGSQPEGVEFDPGTVRVTKFTDTEICFLFDLVDGVITMKGIKVCFDPMRTVPQGMTQTFSGLELVAEPLASAPRGSAWVLGLRPIKDGGF